MPVNDINSSNIYIAKNIRETIRRWANEAKISKTDIFFNYDDEEYGSAIKINIFTTKIGEIYGTGYHLAEKYEKIIQKIFTKSKIYNTVKIKIIKIISCLSLDEQQMKDSIDVAIEVS